jgi:hypothetical protein
LKYFVGRGIIENCMMCGMILMKIKPQECNILFSEGWITIICGLIAFLLVAFKRKQKEIIGGYVRVL